jgi:integrase
VQQWWTEICEKAAITRVTIHGIRATFITLALDAGEAPPSVQKLVGHRSITTTMKYYRNTQQDREAASRIRNVLGIAVSGPVTASVPAVHVG